MLIRSDYETFNRSARDERIHDFGDVRDADATIKKVVGLYQNCDAAFALIETAR